jgi:uncharacterized membrane protein
MRKDHTQDDLTFGDRAAEIAMASMGSWTFIIVQSLIVGAWIILNSVAWFHHWDSFPFILLNLAFSTQAAYAAPLILIAQNHLAANDRAAAEHDRATVKHVATLTQQNQDILEFLRDHLAAEVDYLIEREHNEEDAGIT